MSRRTTLDPQVLEFLENLLSTGDWVSARVIQSAVHRRFGDPVYKPEMDVLRVRPGIDFEDRVEGSRHHYFYRLHYSPV